MRLSLFCGCLCSASIDTARFRKNLDELEKEMKHLKDLRNDFRQEMVVSETEKDGKVPAAEREVWFGEVELLQRKVSLLQARVVVMNNNKKKFCGCFRNCGKRCKAAGEAARLLREIEILQSKARSFPEAKDG